MLSCASNIIDLFNISLQGKPFVLQRLKFLSRSRLTYNVTTFASNAASWRHMSSSYISRGRQTLPNAVLRLKPLATRPCKQQ